MKKYKVLRDTPIDKAGDILYEFEDNYQNDRTALIWHSRHVENNPEWFEEVKEDKMISAEKHFNQWCSCAHSDPRNIPDLINEYGIMAWNAAIDYYAANESHSIESLKKPKDFKF